MNVKMLEYFQGSGVSAIELPKNVRAEVLTPGKFYKIDETLGKWLLDNGKAVLAKEDEVAAEKKAVAVPDVQEVDIEAKAEPAARPARKRGEKLD